MPAASLVRCAGVEARHARGRGQGALEVDGFDEERARGEEGRAAPLLVVDEHGAGDACDPSGTSAARKAYEPE